MISVLSGIKYCILCFLCRSLGSRYLFINFQGSRIAIVSFGYWMSNFIFVIVGLEKGYSFAHLARLQNIHVYAIYSVNFTHTFYTILNSTCAHVMVTLDSIKLGHLLKKWTFCGYQISFLKLVLRNIDKVLCMLRTNVAIKVVQISSFQVKCSCGFEWPNNAIYAGILPDLIIS